MTRRPAGVCRSQSPAACWSRTCRPSRATNSSATDAGSPRVCGRRAARHGRCPAASWCRDAGRSAVVSRTPTCCSPAASSTTRRALPSGGRIAQRRPGDPGHLAHAGLARHRQPRRRGRRGFRPGRAGVLAVRRADRGSGRCTASRCSGSSPCRSPRPRWAMPALRSKTSSSWPAPRRGWERHAPLPSGPATQAAVATAESALTAARALYYQAIEAAWRASQHGEAVPVGDRNRLRLAATHATRTSADVVRADVRPRGR